MLTEIPILTLILWSPLLGVLAVLLLPAKSPRLLRTAGIIGTLLPLLLAFWLFANYNPEQGGAAYEEQASWIEVPLNKEAVPVDAPPEFYTYNLQFEYHLGVDGLSLPLLLLAALVTAMAAFASVYIKKRWKVFYVWFLLLEVGMLGVFLARDLVLFFLFFELTLIASYFLIGIWGSYNKEKAANKLLIYNGLGSALMLIAFVILIAAAGFSYTETDSGLHFLISGNYDVILQNLSDPDALVHAAGSPFYMSAGLQWAIFILLLIAFGIKLPIFPFHTWMLKVHLEAPPALVMIHSGVLLKMGAYGLLKFGVFLFPHQTEQWAVLLAVLGVINILYGALLAMRQTEFKLVLAYSSMSHMGIVLLGIASLGTIGLQGAVFQLISHGLISALLFLIVGSLYERTGTTNIAELGGLARAMPFMSGILLVAGLASLGLPGLSGFVGELLALLGLFATMKWLTAVAALGIILTAVYVLRAVLGITYGPIDDRYAALGDARLVESLPMVVLTAFIILLGVYPGILTNSMQYSFDLLLNQLHARAGG
ncbi:NADH-quinone oxidoreductase subunit M [Paenibacillaceae bacterium]|nr:NADH-quinone oxidoreductase subunit M [Paenibacillaceae bacterium]